MRTLYIVLLAFIYASTGLIAQSSPVILKMDIEQVADGNEIIAHLRVLQFDSMVGYQIGVEWDTNHAQFLAVEDEGPLGQYGSYEISTDYMDVGFFHNIWIEDLLQCTHLDSGNVLFSIRFNKLDDNLVFKLIADSTVHVIGSYSTKFETLGCDFKYKKIIYIDNVQDTMIVENGIVLAEEIPELWQPLHLYPNPAKDVLYIQKPGPEPLHWKLYDVNGSLVLQGKMENYIESIGLSNVLSGQYFLQLQALGRGNLSLPVQINH